MIHLYVEFGKSPTSIFGSDFGSLRFRGPIHNPPYLHPVNTFLEFYRVCNKGKFYVGGTAFKMEKLVSNFYNINDLTEISYNNKLWVMIIKILDNSVQYLSLLNCQPRQSPF